MGSVRQWGKCWELLIRVIIKEFDARVRDEGLGGALGLGTWTGVAPG